MATTPPRAAQASALDDLPFHLARTALAFRRFSDQTLRMVGLGDLPAGVASVLHALDEQGACPVNGLIESTHLPNGTLTGLLDNLERDGLVTRTRNPDDGRSWLVGLTKKGNALCTKLHVRHRNVMRHLRNVLTPAESEKLKSLLQKISVSLRKYSPSDNGPASSPSRKRISARKTQNRTRK
jgi:DNA-binding MarR family transcriptional regulator